jgi:hypothetical protein
MSLDTNIASLSPIAAVILLSGVPLWNRGEQNESS